MNEKKLSEKLINNGYLINKVESKKSLTYIENFIKKRIIKYLKTKNISVNSINLNKLHQTIDLKNLNNLRLKIISEINLDKNFRLHYYNISKQTLSLLVGNELAMQKNEGETLPRLVQTGKSFLLRFRFVHFS